MADLALAWDFIAGAADLALTDDGTDFLTDNGLQTAVMLSLFLNRKARPDDKPPTGTADVQGWWADQYAQVKGDLIGSRRWLLDRPTGTADFVKRLQDYDREALAWLVDDKVASAVDVLVEIKTPEQWSAIAVPFREKGYLETITIHRPASGGPSRFRFALNWQAQFVGVA